MVFNRVFNDQSTNLSKTNSGQFAFAPFMEVELGMLGELKVADLVNQLTKFLASNPWV